MPAFEINDLAAPLLVDLEPERAVGPIHDMTSLTNRGRPADDQKALLLRPPLMGDSPRAVHVIAVERDDDRILALAAPLEQHALVGRVPRKAPDMRIHFETPDERTGIALDRPVVRCFPNRNLEAAIGEDAGAEDYRTF